MLARTIGLALGFVATLAGCGGGDGGSGPVGPDPLVKYVGTFTACDDHEKATFVLASVGVGVLSNTSRFDVFENKDCTGGLLGTRTYSAPETVTYVESVPVSGAPYGSVDKIQMSAPQRTASLTGPGVSGQCVNYPGGQLCYDEGATPPAKTETGGIALAGNQLYVFELVNGVLKPTGDVLTKN